MVMCLLQLEDGRIVTVVWDREMPLQCYCVMMLFGMDIRCYVMVHEEYISYMWSSKCTGCMCNTYVQYDMCRVHPATGPWTHPYLGWTRAPVLWTESVPC